MTDPIDLLAEFVLANPRLSGVGLAVSCALAVLGAVCAQIDPAALERSGHPRAAIAVRIGSHLGSFAFKLISKTRSRQ